MGQTWAPRPRVAQADVASLEVRLRLANPPTLAPELRAAGFPVAAAFVLEVRRRLAVQELIPATTRVERPALAAVVTQEVRIHPARRAEAANPTAQAGLKEER